MTWTPDDWTEAAEERSAIAEHMGGLTREAADTYGQEWLLECLSRWILQHGLDGRRAFLHRWEERHGPESAARVRQAVKAEWDRQRKSGR